LKTTLIASGFQFVIRNSSFVIREAMLWWTLQQLKSSNADVRVNSARSLGSTKQKKAVPSLIKSLQDENQQVRLAAIEALGAIGHPASADPLISALVNAPKTAKSGVAAECQSIAEALAFIGSAATKPLTLALSSEDRDARRWAACALGMIKDPQAVDPLIQALEDSRSEVRKAAALALGQIGDGRALKALIKALTSRDLETRRAAAEALGYIGSEEGAGSLMKAVADPGEPVQLAAIRSLAKIGGLPAASCLRSAVYGTRKSVSEAAEAALKSIQFSPATAEERAEWAVIQGNIESAAREGAAALPALAKALQLKDPQMRLKAVEGLALIRSPGSVPLLLQALKDHHAPVQESAARALAGLGEAACPELEATLSHYDASVVRLAAVALGAIGNPRSVPSLASLISANGTVPGEYPDLFDAVQAAIESLGKILTASAAGIDLQDLQRIAELPEQVRLLGQVAKSADCTGLRNTAAEELRSR
jgi:HEAT repeat protein